MLTTTNKKQRRFQQGGYSALLLLCLLLAVPAYAQPGYDSARCYPTGFAAYTVECGSLSVPEDWQNPDGRTIQLAAMVIRSQSATPAPDPLVYLIGGPGGPLLIQAKTIFFKVFAPFAEDRDIIFLDQRGVGHSSPALYCTEIYGMMETQLRGELSPEEERAMALEALQACQTRLAAQQIDTNHYTSAAIVQDLQALRQALGYETWNLLGISYGTRLALTALRDTPAGIRSVILDSVYPPQRNLYAEFLTNSQQAMQRLFAACAADAACNSAYPDLENTFWTLYDQFQTNAPKIPVNSPDIGRFDLPLTGNRLYDAVFNWLYDVDTIPLIPYRVAALAAGNFDVDIIHAILRDEISTVSIYMGMYYAVQCGEEVRFTSPETLEALPEQFPRLATYIARALTLTPDILTLCAAWSTAPLNPIENEAVSSDIPALVLAGQFDPITPPAWAEEVAATLANSFYYEMPGVGHGVTRSTSCGIKIALAFLANPTVEPDTACIAAQSPPPFYVPASISTPVDS